jgi:hypothetical protein
LPQPQLKPLLIPHRPVLLPLVAVTVTVTVTVRSEEALAEVADAVAVNWQTPSVTPKSNVLSK